MKMKPRELELIALEHVLARYRITGVLPNINGQPFDINQFKKQISVGADVDTDININIDNVKNEIVECDNESHQPTNEADSVTEVQTAVESAPSQETSNTTPEPIPEPIAVQPPEESNNQEKSNIAGKLFQFFNPKG